MSFYPFTFIIKKTTANLKKYLFANILSYSYQLKKIRLKKVYIIFNNSKNNRDFNSNFFTMMQKIVCDDIFQGYKNPEKKSNLIYTTPRHIVRCSSWRSFGFRLHPQGAVGLAQVIPRGDPRPSCTSRHWLDFTFAQHCDLR